VELKDIAAARHEAVVTAGEVIRDQPDIVWRGEELRMEVTDSNRTLLFTVIVLGVDAPSGRELAN
jgi:hypothetical protein